MNGCPMCSAEGDAEFEGCCSDPCLSALYQYMRDLDDAHNLHYSEVA